MTAEKPRIGILGAGALGAFYGARLFRAGHDVHFLMRRDFDHVRAHGIEVRSFEGDFRITPPVYPDAKSLGPCDLVIIGLKSTDNSALPALLEPLCHPSTVVLTLQNGLGNEEQVARALAGQDAGERVMGGIAFLCSNRTGPGQIHHIDHGWIRLGEFRGKARPRTEGVAELFRSSGIRCEVYDSLLQARWEKLVWNIPFNGLGVAACADTAAILADPELTGLVHGLMEEVGRAAAVDGVTIPPELCERMVANTRTMGSYRTSMQIDFEQGRRLEVESILGEPLRRARRGGVEVPRLEMLHVLVQRLDRFFSAGAQHSGGPRCGKVG